MGWNWTIKFETILLTPLAGIYYLYHSSCEVLQNIELVVVISPGKLVSSAIFAAWILSDCWFQSVSTWHVPEISVNHWLFRWFIPTEASNLQLQLWLIIASLYIVTPTSPRKTTKKIVIHHNKQKQHLIWYT